MSILQQEDARADYSGGRVPEVGYSVLRSTGKQPPLFWITPDPGQSSVVLALGDDRPVYLLRAPKRAAGDPPLTLTEMARRYAVTVVRLRPTGPYILLGYCVAGTVAYETARILFGEHRDQGHVVMIDPPDPKETRGSFVPDPLWFRCGFALSRAWFHGRRLARMGLAAQAAYVRVAVGEFRRRLQYARNRRLHTQVQESGAAPPDVLADSYFATVAAFQTSVPAPITVPVTLIRPTDVPHGAFEYANRRWLSLYRGRSRVLEAQGDSRSMWAPNGAAAIRAAIESAWLESGDGV